MTIADNRKEINGQVIFQCPWCPNFFFSKYDLDVHLGAKEFRVLGKEPNQFDHKVRWNDILWYRDKREPYERDLDGY